MSIIIFFKYKAIFCKNAKIPSTHTNRRNCAQEPEYKPTIKGTVSLDQKCMEMVLSKALG
jgi:hypothetical protein